MARSKASTPAPPTESLPSDKPKARRKKASPQETSPGERIVIQHQGKEWELSAIKEKVITDYVTQGHRRGRIANLELYVKPEDGKVYYVINGKTSGESVLE